MGFVQKSVVLTHAATMQMLQAAVAKAEEIDQPQCIVCLLYTSDAADE